MNFNVESQYILIKINKELEMVKKDSNKSFFLQERLNEWNDFIKDLHLGKPNVELTKREVLWRFINKLLIVFFAAGLTTFSLYVFINPNGIYNSGLNGLLQIITKALIGYNIDELSWRFYYVIYYGLNFAINFLIVFFLSLFFKTRLEITGTSFFYIFFQIIWTLIFDFFKFGEIFGKFNLENLDFSSRLFYFTLPYYILISIIASLINSYGNSLIFQAKSTVGGFDIIYTHISSRQGKKNDNKKKNFFLSSKILSILIVFVITLSNFFLTNNKNFVFGELLRDFNKLVEKKSEEIKEEENLIFLEKYNFQKNSVKFNISSKNFEYIIEEWKREVSFSMNEATVDVSKFELYEKKRKWKFITDFFINKFKDPYLDKYPYFLEFYLLGSTHEAVLKMEEIMNKMEKEKNIFLNSGSDIYISHLERIAFLKGRIRKIESELKKNTLQRYLTYISDDEKFWGTIVFIFFSSMIMKNIFPRDKNIFLQIYSTNEEDQNSILKILEKENVIPFYGELDSRLFDEKKKTYFTWCYLNKWNYSLLSSNFEYLGKRYVTEVD